MATDGMSGGLRHVLRVLWKSPGFTLIAVVSLAVGIGANTAIFSVINALLVRPLPLADAHELVSIYRDRATGRYEAVSYPDYLEILDGSSDVFRDVAGVQPVFVQAEFGNSVETLTGQCATGNFFPLVGIRALLGRTILPSDHVSPGAHPVVVLGHSYWLRRYGGDPAVLGETLRLSGRPYTIVGVMGPGYPGLVRVTEADFFAPIMMVPQLMPLGGEPLESRGWNAFLPVARLGDGVSAASVRVTLDRIASYLSRSFPESWPEGDRLIAAPTADVIVDPVSDRVLANASLVALALVGLLLLAACCNVAGFVLARATDRRAEIAMRITLGATRKRLAGQLLAETLVLALAGGAVGLWLANVALGGLVGMTAALPVPIAFQTRLDVTVLTFTLAISCLTGLLVGLAPVFQARCTDIVGTLVGGVRSGTSRWVMSAGRVLVGGQMAVSLALLVAAAVLLRSLHVSKTLDPGFGREPAGLISFMVPVDRFDEDEGRTLVSSIREEARRIPGVRAVGQTGNLHLSMMNRLFLDVTVDGMAPPPGRSVWTIDFTPVDSEFFAAAGVPLLEGRNFDGRDDEDGARVAIINQAMAARLWPDESPIGRTIRVSGFDDRTVIGVAGTAKIRSLGEPPTPVIYLPHTQWYSAWITLVARTDDEVSAVAATRDLFRLLREEYPDVVISDSRTLAEHLELHRIQPRLSAWLSSTLAGLALVLSVGGLFGAVSYAVSRRRHEIGVRVALGADPGSVVRLIVGTGMRPVLVGGVIGVPAALLLCNGISELLYGVSPFDPLSLFAAPAALLGAALIAAFIPARRGSRIDPVRALKMD